ncbi:ABC transporter substrate-binding protein [Frankia tisae]|uniref:ABC transporter substrate-binding protein n=1 Tax=Frankia tisae TaxID=2950104 RepID=UPI0021C13673|nr:ABC transporter substrate-binding protein [Frankia tisae]
MKVSRRKAAAVLGVAAALILSACSGSGSAEVTPASAAGAPRSGGSLTYLDYQVPYSFNFINLSYWQNQPIDNSVLDRLVFQDPGTAKLYPWIAQSWDKSKDGLTYTFVIRKGVTYSDGTVLDAGNVKKNLEFQAFGDGKGNIRNAYFPAVESVSADDATSTVTVRLKQPNSYFLATLSYQTAGLVSTKYFSLSYKEQGKGTNLLGSGPFVITENSPTETKIVRREGYNWAPPVLKHQGEAYLNSVTFVPVVEDSVRLGTLESGQADVIHYIQPSEQAKAQQKGLQIITQRFLDGTQTSLAFGTSSGYLSDINVRKAIALAVDRDKLVKTIYAPGYLPATGLLRSGAPDFVASPDVKTYDPAAAGKLLEQSGWVLPPGSEVRQNSAGQKLTIKALIDVYNVTSPALYQYLQIALKAIGIDLELKQVDYSDYPQAAKNPDLSGFKLLTLNRDAAYNLARDALSTYGDYFQLKDKDPELASAAKSIISGNLDPAQQHEEIVKLQAGLINHYYLTPLVDIPQVFVAQPSVHGFSQIRSSPWLYNTWLSK